MPEFILNGKEKPEFSALPEMVQGFIEAMFFTDCANGVDSDDWFSDENQNDLEQGQTDGNLPSDVGFAELHPDSLAAIVTFCQAFEAAAKDLLQPIADGEIDGYDTERVGHDLWYTSQGHGVGFWDRKELELVGEDQEEYERLTQIMVQAGHDSEAWNAALTERKKLVSLGDKLSEIAQYHEASTWYDEDGFVYCEINF
jgi:hypothetical protein